MLFGHCSKPKCCKWASVLSFKEQCHIVSCKPCILSSVLDLHRCTTVDGHQACRIVTVPFTPACSCDPCACRALSPLPNRRDSQLKSQFPFYKGHESKAHVSNLHYQNSMSTSWPCCGHRNQECGCMCSHAHSAPRKCMRKSYASILYISRQQAHASSSDKYGAHGLCARCLQKQCAASVVVTQGQILQPKM